MRIRLLTRMAGPDGNYAPGHLIEVSSEAGRQLIAGGYAEAAGEAQDKPAVIAVNVEEATLLATEQAVTRPPKKRKH